MAKFNFSFDAKKFQKSLEKEIQKAIKKEQAAASVSMQPEFEGIKILDKACEDALRVILEKYDGNDSLSVSGGYCIFRPHPDTDSGNIRTAFRNYPDSITAYPDTLSND